MLLNVQCRISKIEFKWNEILISSQIWSHLLIILILFIFNSDYSESMWLIESSAEWFAEEYTEKTHFHYNAYMFTTIRPYLALWQFKWYKVWLKTNFSCSTSPYACLSVRLKSIWNSSFLSVSQFPPTSLNIS